VRSLPPISAATDDHDDDADADADAAFVLPSTASIRRITRAA
jgi:hypothetical protein